MSALSNRIYEELVRRRGEFCKPAELAPGVSRALVWKAMTELREAGCVIEGRPRVGYCLRDDSGFAYGPAVARAMTTRWLGKKLIVAAELDSTNNELKRLAASGEPSGTVVWADHQTAGRGRQGRSWTSARGEALQFSLLWRPALTPRQGALTTQVAAASLLKTLREAGFDVAVKWPNDLQIGGKKFCGVLSEMLCDGEGVAWIILGIGLNVNQQQFDASLPGATSLRAEGGRVLSRNGLLAALLNDLEGFLDRYVSQGPEESLALCRTHGALLGRRITYEGGAGTAQDVDEQGRLVVLTDDGTLTALMAGEVHLGAQ